MNLPKRLSSLAGVACLLSLMLASATVRGGALEDYVQQPDQSYSWKVVSTKQEGDFTVARLELVSQKWRESVWKHHLLVVRPKTVRNPDVGLLYIIGDGTGEGRLKALKMLAEHAGAVTAVITDIPNQPLYDGKKEDALIAYTFSQYVHTGDPTWPVLLPMVKSAVRGLDAMQEYTKKEFNQKLERFVVTGASKRGWTTWLTAAADKRVAGIAPMVIDVLNMKAQAEWQKKVYGKQSEKINDYKNADLLSHMDEPPMVKLREWVDPYSYRSRYTMPKLLLLGTNDPYWTVDSLRLYWNDLPGPKLIYQTPNAGHDLNGGNEAMQTLAAFFETIADHKSLPKMDWQINYNTNGVANVRVQVDGAEVKSALLWTATSTDRDFRDDRWSSQQLKLAKGTTRTESVVSPPQAGYRAFLVEADLVSPTGYPYKLSTQARVTPDTSPSEAAPQPAP
jgi:PhoPQ-activated pathogenicity-related protein